MWVPSGEYFVADRPRGGQQTGTVMDYLVAQGSRADRPESYGIHNTGRTAFGENGDIPRPRANHASMVGRVERPAATRSYRFNPLVRPEPATAGMGSRKTVARRERRERLRAVRNPPPPPTINVTTTTTTTPASGGAIQGGDDANGNSNNEAGPTPPPTPATTTAANSPLNIPTIIIYNSKRQSDGDTTTPQIATLNLSDDDDGN
ncbi:unnamed protein product [Rotaria sp. Silwood1]|nr:unnamed protein product [Rotaria sp. Silwood1]CAF1681986.1 unnamed protein product [Rotaria sp. Silwood1]CAF3867599.1 unnamed protein product [Rotaria sp. Silwood1]CAF3903410.1 unnamed protein product [Rotaria sp. Silwood1]CAF4898815.1 unnamed protein product [Rotaria sp. Silwood1]